MHKIIPFLLLIGALNASLFAQSKMELIGDYLIKNQKKYGLIDKDLKSFRLDHTNDVNRNGASTYYFQQQFDDIDIQNAMLIVTFDKQNQIVHIGNSAIGKLGELKKHNATSLQAADATVLAAKSLGIERPETPQLTSRSGEYPITFSQPSYTKSPIKVEKKYILRNGELHLVHQIALEMAAGSDFWLVNVGTGSGEIISKINQTIYCKIHEHQYQHNDQCVDDKTSQKEIKKSANLLGAATSSYRVVPFPSESPSHGPLELLTDPFFPEASPFGWHDTNGEVGPEYTITRGNNANAFADKNNNDLADPDTPSPDGGASLTFDFSLDPNQDPLANANASIVNLFYAVNYMHDVSFLYGFDEISGNFQSKNYTNTGKGGDQVNANALDGMSTSDPMNFNNANFTPSTDGNPGKMQMYLWDRAASAINITEPEDIGLNIREYELAVGWGLPIPNFSQNPIIGQLAIALDNTPSPTRLCDTAKGDLSGKFAIIERGECDFSEKAYNAQAKGAVGCFVCNAEGINGGNGEELIMMSGGDFANLVNIPALFLKKSDCDRMKSFLNRGIDIFLKLQTPENSGPRYLDAAFDNGIVAHEYGHGISTRLVGGPGNSSCLNNLEQMGEGWSDFFALAFTVKPGDNGSDSRGIGTYASSQPTSGFGIRRFPYSTDLSINPQSYDQIKGTGSSHSLGEVWADMLWDYYWLMADKYGFDPDVKNLDSGNGMAVKTVFEALKIQGCQPGFVEGREALIAADRILYEGQNECLIWEAFSRRGLGFYADGGSSNDADDGIENFDALPTCIEKLKISKILPSVANAGELIKVQLKTINHIKATIAGVFVEDILPEGATVVEGSANYPMSISGNKIRFDLGTMAYEEEKNITYDISAPLNKSKTLIFYNIDGGIDGFDIELTAGFGTWTIADIGAKSGQQAFFIGNYNEINDHALYAPIMRVTGEKPVLRFFHKFETEASYDGGFVQFTRDGGNTWAVVPKDKYLRNGPNSVISYNTLPIPSLFGFSGSSHGAYVDTYIDLEEFKGEDLRFRFRFVSDSAVAPTNGGWYIDDIELMDIVLTGSLACINDLTLEKENCTIESLIIINSDVALNNTIIKDNDFEMSVSPNPTNDLININIQSTSSQDIKILLRSMDGKVLKVVNRKIYPEVNTLQLDLQDLQPGMYLIDLLSEKQSRLTQKVIKI